MDAARVTELKERADRALRYDQPYGPAQDVLDLLKALGREQERVRALTPAAQDKWEAEATTRGLEGLLQEASRRATRAVDERNRAVASPGLTLCEEGCLRERFAAAWTNA